MKRLLLFLFVALCFMVDAQAQEWNTLDTQAWVQEWRTMDNSFVGPAKTDKTGAYKVYVRSEAQALAAGNMLDDGTGHIAVWDTQFFISFGSKNALRLGDVLSVSFKVKADVATQFTTYSETEPGNYLDWKAIGVVDATTKWKEVSREVTADDNNNGLPEGTYTIAINLADGNENNVYFKDIVVKLKRATSSIDHWEDIIINGDLTEDDMTCFYQRVYPAADASQAAVTDGAIVINSPVKVENDWDTSFFIVLPQTLPAGAKFKVHFDCKASVPVTVGTQTHNAPTEYIHWDCIGDVPFGTGWSTYETTATVSDESDGSDSGGGYTRDFHTICFNLSKNQEVTYYFKNIRVEIPVYSDKVESNKLVELPDGIEAQKWMIDGTMIESTTLTTKGINYQTQVAFDGTDVYVQGLSYTFRDAWLKGTLNKTTGLITFPRGQYVGETEDYYAYMIGYEEGETCDIVLQYDAEKSTLTQVTPEIINSASWVAPVSIDTWKNLVIYKYKTYTEYDASTQTLTYYYDGKYNIREGETELYDPIGNPDAVRFAGYSDKVTKAVIDPSMKDAPLTSMEGMFYGGMDPETFKIYSLPNLTTIEGLENLNTFIATDMGSMFVMCSSLTSLDLSSFNTSNVTDMGGMFLGCNALQTVDVSSFDVTKVTNMSMMFGSCRELTTICCNTDWRTSPALTNSYLMFSGCKKIVGDKGTTFIDDNNKDATYAHPDGGTSDPGYFSLRLKGDADGNGQVNAADIVAISNYMIGNPPAGFSKANADVNLDGIINIADIVAVSNIIMN